MIDERAMTRISGASLFCLWAVGSMFIRALIFGPSTSNTALLFLLSGAGMWPVAYVLRAVVNEARGRHK